MSDILIKGMEMPTSDDDVKLIINSDGSVHRIIGWAVSEKTKAKAIPVPEHGDLVNLGDVYEAINREIVPKGMFLSDFYKAFADIPTVLEASK